MTTPRHMHRLARPRPVEPLPVRPATVVAMAVGAAIWIGLLALGWAVSG